VLELITFGIVTVVMLLAAFLISLKSRRKITLEERLYHRKTSYRVEEDRELNVIERLELDLKQSRVNISVSVYFLIGIVGAASVFFLFQYLLEDIIIAVIAAAVIGFYIPKQLLVILKEKKMQEFDNSFSKALKRMSASMRSGSSMLQAVQSVVDTPAMPKVIREEMALILIDYDYGDSIDIAFRKMAERTGVKDVKSIAISIEIGMRQGSKLFEVFDSYVNTIMDRKESEAEARATLSATRASVNILVSVPFLFTAGMKVMSPGYFDLAYGYAGGLGKYIYFAIYGFVIAGYVYLVRKCNIRI